MTLGMGLDMGMGQLPRTAPKLPIMRHAARALSLCNGLPWIGINCRSIPQRHEISRADKIIVAHNAGIPYFAASIEPRKDRATQTACCQLPHCQLPVASWLHEQIAPVLWAVAAVAFCRMTN